MRGLESAEEKHLCSVCEAVEFSTKDAEQDLLFGSYFQLYILIFVLGSFFIQFQKFTELILQPAS